MDGSDVTRTVRSPIGTMSLLEGGVIVHTLDDGVVVTADVGAEVVRLTGELAGDERVAVVVDLGNIAFADAETRSFFAEADVEGSEVATALVAKPRVAQFLGNLWQKYSEPARPTSMFEDLDEAIAWALDQVQQARDG